jgi:hypothetical protein
MCFIISCWYSVEFSLTPYFQHYRWQGRLSQGLQRLHRRPGDHGNLRVFSLTFTQSPVGTAWCGRYSGVGHLQQGVVTLLLPHGEGWCHSLTEMSCLCVAPKDLVLQSVWQPLFIFLVRKSESADLEFSQLRKRTRCGGSRDWHSCFENIPQVEVVRSQCSHPLESQHE